MRLTEFERATIKKVFLEIFKEGKIYLFGSRVDDTKLGGDIDLYLRPKTIFMIIVIENLILSNTQTF